MKLDERINEDIGKLIDELQALGYAVVAQEASGMGYVVDLKGEPTLRIVCDRGQLFLHGDEKELEKYNLWRVHDSRGAFQKYLLAYINAKRKAK